MTTGAHNRSIGDYGERVAAQWLTARGMVVLDRNWRCRQGEVDLVLRDDDTLVFCEVKTRASVAFGHPLEAVTPAKYHRLRRLAALWMESHQVRARNVRIDVVGVLRPARGAAVVDHLKGVG